MNILFNYSYLFATILSQIQGKKLNRSEYEPIKVNVKQKTHSVC